MRALFQQTLLAYGGIDNLVITAGFYYPPDANGHIPDEMWDTTFDVNVKGAYIVADEARKIWQAQGLPGSLVVATSANGVMAKKGSLAYDASKAAANHLVRELAIELAPNVRVNGLAPATVVAGSTMFPRKRVISSLIKYELPFDESEETDALRERLAEYYAQRTLTKQSILPEDQAEAAYLLLSGAFGQDDRPDSERGRRAGGGVSALAFRDRNGRADRSRSWQEQTLREWRRVDVRERISKPRRAA